MVIPHPCIELSNLDMKDKMITMNPSMPCKDLKLKFLEHSFFLVVTKCGPWHSTWMLEIFHLFMCPQEFGLNPKASGMTPTTAPSRRHGAARA
jgi:hypothetical protein